jgi:lysophospholipase L1-like esterase
MIIFLGDSFTWGQGLYLKKWIDEGKSIEYCNRNLPPIFPQQNISHSDDLYRKKYHFPNLVAEHYNRSYYTKPKNGGTNGDIYNILKNMYSYVDSSAIDLVVIQFTDFSRSLEREIGEFDLSEDIDSILYSKCKKQIDIVYDTLKKLKIDNFLFFGWRNNVGKLIADNYSKFYIPINYQDFQYHSIESFISNNGMTLGDSLGVDDGHLSELGHQVIANSIIKKVDTMNIDFRRPK